MSSNGSLSGGQALASWFQKDAVQAQLIQQIVTGLNNLGQNIGAAPMGQLPPPTAPSSVDVTAADGIAHVAITDNAPVNKGIQYFTEVDTSPAFPQPMVIAHGPSRTSAPFPLPANDSSGAAQSFYFRSYSQYPGGLPSAKTVYGGASAATAVSVGGSASLTLLPSKGSGTASPAGTQGGHGFGVVSSRPAQGPKRGKAGDR